MKIFSRGDPLIRQALFALGKVVPRQAQHDVGATAREHTLAAVFVCAPIHVPRTINLSSLWDFCGYRHEK